MGGKKTVIFLLVIISIFLSQCKYIPISNALNEKVYLISPQNGSKGVSKSPILKWLDPFYGDGDEKFLVYLSTKPSEVAEDSENALIGETSDLEFKVDGLNKGKTYYWKVVGKNGDIKALSPIWSFETNSFEIVENKSLGSPYEDGAFSIKSLRGRYIIGGYVGYPLPDVRESLGAPAVFKVDKDGELIWVLKLGENGTIYDIEISSDGKNIIAVGADNNDVSPTISGIVSKISADNGKLLFKKDLAPNTTLFGITSDGSYFATVGVYMLGFPDSDIVILKLDESGNPVRKKVLDYGSMDYVHDVISTENGYMAVGSSDKKGLIIFLDKNLEILDHKLLENCTSFYKLIRINERYVAIGYSDKLKTFHYPDGSIEGIYPILSPCIATINERGEIQSTKRFFNGYSSYNFIPYSATLVGSDTLLLVGVRTRTLSNNTFYEYPSHLENAVSDPDDNQDLMIMKLTSSGSVAGYEYFGGSQEDGGFDIVEEDGEIVIIGRTWSNNGDIYQNLGKSDIWFLKIVER